MSQPIWRRSTGSSRPNPLSACGTAQLAWSADQQEWRRALGVHHLECGRFAGGEQRGHAVLGFGLGDGHDSSTIVKTPAGNSMRRGRRRRRALQGLGRRDPALPHPLNDAERPDHADGDDGSAGDLVCRRDLAQNRIGEQNREARYQRGEHGAAGGAQNDHRAGVGEQGENADDETLKDGLERPRRKTGASMIFDSPNARYAGR